LIRFSPDEAATAAYGVGRNGSWLWRLVEPVMALAGMVHVAPYVEVDIDRVRQYLRDTLPGIEQEPVPAQLIIDLAGNVQIQPEQAGHIIHAAVFAQGIQARVAELSREPLEVAFQDVTPSLTQQKLVSLLSEARRVVATDVTLAFAFDDKAWSAKPEVWRTWLGAREESSIVTLAFTTAAAREFFDSLAAEVNQPAYDAKFEVQNGRVAAFQSSQPGRAVDVAATMRAAEAALVAGVSKPVTLTVAVTEPTVTTAEANDLGITELIGVGTSNFKGSPKNRRHNIKVGADSLNGLLVKPDETFSLLKALGTIDASTGYLPELVIKGNKTIPEYGGGLCQIGTTTFRAALGSGLPIVERRNHSYRVVYYEPAGTDATIYDPAPDFKFKNDTGGTILIQTKVQGDDLRFEFWGTKDGRQVEQTKPRIFNVTVPPPTKIVETEDLEPGEKKCTEKPHNGADAEFTYTVTYADGRKDGQVFKSHYVPWQEVCLLGVPKGTLTPAEGEAPANPDGSTGSETLPVIPTTPEAATPSVP
jgi:vancomycin resistance protein YoaR